MGGMRESPQVPSLLCLLKDGEARWLNLGLCSTFLSGPPLHCRAYVGRLALFEFPLYRFEDFFSLQRREEFFIRWSNVVRGELYETGSCLCLGCWPWLRSSISLNFFETSKPPRRA